MINFYFPKAIKWWLIFQAWTVCLLSPWGSAQLSYTCVYTVVTLFFHQPSRAVPTSFFSLLLLLPSLPLTTGSWVRHWEELVCRLDRGWIVQDLWKHRSYLPRSHKACVVCKKKVGDLDLLLVKKHVNQWVGVAAKSIHVYLWLLFFDEWCYIYEHSCMNLKRLLIFAEVSWKCIKSCNIFHTGLLKLMYSLRLSNFWDCVQF